jgi:hypothetical protein
MDGFIHPIVFLLKVNRCLKTIGPSETPADGNTGPTSVPLMHPLSIEEDIAAL